MTIARSVRPSCRLETLSRPVRTITLRAGIVSLRIARAAKLTLEEHHAQALGCLSARRYRPSTVSRRLAAMQGRSVTDTTALNKLMEDRARRSVRGASLPSGGRGGGAAVHYSVFISTPTGSPNSPCSPAKGAYLFDIDVMSWPITASGRPHRFKRRRCPAMTDQPAEWKTIPRPGYAPRLAGSA